MANEKRKNDENTPAENAVGPAFALIGIGLIFLLNLDFWPWILIVAAGAATAGLILRGELTWWHLDGVVWLLGLFVIALTGFWWPGILLLVGVSMLLKAVIGTHTISTYMDERHKRKRGFVPPTDDDRFF
ncbi:hypothetical protein [Aggregatilinea lenta]|uniref:hypothetical protein n=1 Tax=Aggregatilinea lenta TaxID=913108 RepID=UPI000E5B5C12|nr:hypothetical protein [Aggregatilinea lenta]